MKKLISAQMVRQANSAGKKEIVAPSQSTLITPEARDLAEKYAIRFVESQRKDPSKFSEIDQETVQQIIKKVLERLPKEKRDPKTVTDAVISVLSGYGN